MSRLLYGRGSLFDSDKKEEHFPSKQSSDSLPLFRRSNTNRRINKDHKEPTFVEMESGESRNNMASSFHLLDDASGSAIGRLNVRDEGRNVALVDGSAEGRKTYSTLAPTTKEDHLSSGGDKEESSSHSSWILLQRGRIILLILAIVYGSLNISMRLVFARPDPPTASASSTIQGWFSVICFAPLLWRNHSNNASSSSSSSNNNNNNNIHTSGLWDIPTIRCRGTVPGMSFWRFALELAIFNFGTQALINMSLVGTQGARASFLVQMSVVFTPVLSVLFGHQKVSSKVWIGCFIALAGLFVLSYAEGDDNNEPAFENSPSLALSWGDWCCLLAALCWSLYIYRLSAWGEFFDETMTQFVKNIVLATLYTSWMLVSLVSRQYYSEGNESLWNGWKNDPIAWIILFYSALGPCTLADVFQQKAQSSVPAAESNVILSLEPVFTTLLGFVLLGEIPSMQEMFGGLLIMIASVIVSCGPQPQPSGSRRCKSQQRS